MRLARAGDAPAVEIATASGPVRTIAGRMKLHSGGTSTTLTSIARRSASSNTRMLTSVSLLAANRSLAGQLDQGRMRLGRDQRHVGVAGQQPLNLLEADVAAADHHAAPTR